MKIAYCILCHRYTKVLKKSIEILSLNSDIYLHVDLKSNIEEFNDIIGKVNLIKDRVKVRWGEYSQIQATINLLYATCGKEYDYIFLLSGDCLPVKNNDEIVNVLSRNNCKEYVAHDIYMKQEDIDNRIKYNYKWYNYKKDKNILEKFLYKTQCKFNLLTKNKLYDRLPKLYKGTNWFGITTELRDYILKYISENEWYCKSFKKSICGDEVFFHTIIFNSKYKDKIYIPKDKSNICFQALRYIDWKTGPEYPKVLNEDDFKKIKSTECLFARKFDTKLDLERYEKYFLE